MPLSCLETTSSEARALYQELRKPLLRYLVCLGISVDEAQDVVQDAFVSLQRHLALKAPRLRVARLVIYALAIAARDGVRKARLVQC